MSTNPTNSRRAGRRIAPGMAVVLAITCTVPVAAAGPAAAAVTGIVTARQWSEWTRDKVAHATVHCPAGKKVLGGGGGAVFEDVFNPSPHTKLVELHPISGEFIGEGFQVTAEEPAHTAPFTWRATAWAICADPVPGLEIVSGSSVSPPASPTFRHATRECPQGKQVVSTGAQVVDESQGEVGLTLTRADGARGISRASAREDADGYAGLWTLITYTVCADPIPATSVSNEIIHGSDWSTTCPGRGIRYLLAAGGGGGTIDTGPHFLQLIFIFGMDHHPEFQLRMTGQLDEGMTTQAICLAG